MYKTDIKFLGSFLLLTLQPGSHFSFFFAVGNFVDTNIELAWVGLISHHGASIRNIKLYIVYSNRTVT